MKNDFSASSSSSKFGILEEQWLTLTPGCFQALGSIDIGSLYALVLILMIRIQKVLKDEKL